MLKAFTDQMGREVMVPFPPRRIISLVPSQSEFLADLGLDDRVAGITKFCIHPESWFKDKPKVGGTKHFNFDAIEALKPDLIIGNKEENYLEGIRQLESRYPVWMSDVNTFDDALQMMVQIGQLTDRLQEAVSITDRIRDSLTGGSESCSLRVLYMIWRNPWMVAGTQTFINDMLTRCGLSNVVTIPRYPEISFEEIRKLQPDVIFLSTEPFPFSEKHVDELSVILPDARVELVDGEMFSWYGSRLVYAGTYFTSLLSKLRSS